MKWSILGRLVVVSLVLGLAVLHGAWGAGKSAHAKDEPSDALGAVERSPSHTGADDPEIRLGMSAAFTKSARALGIELYRGATAYFLGVDEAGGVAGQRIVIKAYDDYYEPDPCIRNTLRLMNEDDVFALFNYVGTPTMIRTLPLLKKYESRNFLLLFPFTGASLNRIPPYDQVSFNLRASYAQETQGLVDHFVAVNRRRIAVFYQVDAYGRAGWTGVINALAGHSLMLAGEATYRRGTRFDHSYDRQVAIIEEVNPDAVISIGTYAACAGFVRDMRNRNVDIPIATLSFVGSQEMLNLLVSAGRKANRDYTRFLVSSQVVPHYDDDSIPVMREYKEKMTRYRDSLMPPDSLLYPEGRTAENEYEPPHYSFTSLEGFLNAKLLVEILRRMGPSPNRADLQEAIMGMTDIDLGMRDRLSFGGPENRRQASDKVYYTVVKGGHFEMFHDADWKAWAKP